MQKYTLIFLIFLIIFITGCSVEPKIEYREKLVPVKCEIPKTELPAYTGDVFSDIPNILIYTEILEADIKQCTGEK